MAYVKTQGESVIKFPYTIGDLRKDNPSTSFPRRISDDVLASYGVYEVQVDASPVVDEKNYKAVRSETPVNVNGEWRLQWSSVEKTDEEKQSHYDGVAGKMRTKRNSKLSETDWTVLQDSPLTDAQTADWVIYRQALRDITDHANFPYLEEADWPTKPE